MTRNHEPTMRGIKWTWLGHTLSIVVQAPHWTPQEHRGIGNSKNICKRAGKMWTQSFSRRELEAAA